jgi:hypothetical protein
MQSLKMKYIQHYPHSHPNIFYFPLFNLATKNSSKVEGILKGHLSTLPPKFMPMIREMISHMCSEGSCVFVIVCWGVCEHSKSEF